MRKSLNTTGSEMKRLPLSIFLGAALLGFASHLEAIAPISDDGELFLTGTASAATNDNIFLSHQNKQSGTEWDFAPGLSYEFGKGSALTKGQLAFNEDFQKYTGVSNLSSKQLANAIFLLNYDDAKNKVNVDASFHQLDQPEVGIQNLGFLVDRDESHISGIGEVGLTEKSSAGAGIVYNDISYKTAGFTDWRYVQVPVNFYYEVEPKLDISAGFRFTDNTLGAGGINSRDYYYNIGARGEFTPKLTGEFDVGYISQQMAAGPSENGLGADSKFTYSYSQKTSLTFGVNDDFGYTATGAAIRNLAILGGFNTALSDQWAFNVLVGYNNYNYQTTSQRDNFYSARVGLTYILNLHCSATLAYSYATDHSNVTLDSFNDDILSLAVTLHF